MSVIEDWALSASILLYRQMLANPYQNQCIKQFDILLHTKIVQSVCVCVCVCVLPVLDFDLKRVRLFVRTSPQFLILEENRLIRREWRVGKSGGRKGIWKGWK